jgi:hypothetical protein
MEIHKITTDVHDAHVRELEGLSHKQEELSPGTPGWLRQILKTQVAVMENNKEEI